MPAKLMEMAIQNAAEGDDYLTSKEWEEKLIGEGIGRRDRESASLGAMGAAQWSGRFMTRPHCEFRCTVCSSFRFGLELKLELSFVIITPFDYTLRGILLFVKSFQKSTIGYSKLHNH